MGCGICIFSLTCSEWWYNYKGESQEVGTGDNYTGCYDWNNSISKSRLKLDFLDMSLQEISVVNADLGM